MRKCSVLVCGTADTKAAELRHLAAALRVRGVTPTVVDLSTERSDGGFDIGLPEVLAGGNDTPDAITKLDRGEAIARVAMALKRYVLALPDLRGIIAIGGSGGAALVLPALSALPLGMPKIIVTTIPGHVHAMLTGMNDVVVLNAVTDLAGLNSISRRVLDGTAAVASALLETTAAAAPRVGNGVAFSMFGVTTSCVTAMRAQLPAADEAFVFHAVGGCGDAFSKLAAFGSLSAIADITTTEICDHLIGGVFPCDDERFAATRDSKLPTLVSCGALDMVNFGPIDSVPPQFRGRKFHRHNANVTLMRTTADECTRIGAWIAKELNRCDGPIILLLPEGGVSALDVPGGPFWDPAADGALFAAIETNLTRTSRRQVVRVAAGINDPAFVAAASRHLAEIRGECLSNAVA
jgi:uncharacterized protein (UPF0261 family)